MPVPAVVPIVAVASAVAPRVVASGAGTLGGKGSRRAAANVRRVVSLSLSLRTVVGGVVPSGPFVGGLVVSRRFWLSLLHSPLSLPSLWLLAWRLRVSLPGNFGTA
jgi:hypothetical protein